MRAVTKFRAQGGVFNAIKRNHFAADLMALFLKRILQCPDAFGRVILQYPIKNQGVVSIDKRSVALAPRSAAPAGSKLLEICRKRLAIVRIPFPFLVRDQSVLIDVLFQQTIITTMVNSGRNVYGAEAK